MQTQEMTQKLTVRSLLPGDDSTVFRTLNEEWISRYFTLEAMDNAVLGDPERMILRKGGQIFLLDLDGETVGCVALIPMGNGVYELSKMAVAPGHRGLGLGRRLIEHTIAQARVIGARSLFLGSSTKLANAVHLYESVGFQHVPPERLPKLEYKRADVFMEMALE